MGDFGEDSDDSDGEGGMGNVTRMIMRPPGHSGKAKRGHLCFDASFETGNLGRVDLVNEYEYDLFVRPDTCCPRLRFWFNFTVDNVKQDQRVIFNIINFSKSRTLFNNNLTPIVKSTTRPKWRRIPKRYVFYHKSPVHRGTYVLSFAFAFDKEDEIFQFALAAPYSYSKLQSYLSVLERKAAYLKESFKREPIGNSVQNRRIDLVTIGSVDKTETNEKKRVVAIMARVHPGETPASYVCQGLLELLISSHPVANLLREHVVFKVIPMINPDGVFLGNYRTNLMGVDLNRSWHVATPWGHPTLCAVSNTLLAIDKNKEVQLDFVVDIHAHSTLKGCFVYGNTYEDVYRYERHIVLPKLLSLTADDYVTANAMFNNDMSKVGTARRHLCSILNDHVNSYTFEVSIYGYQLKNSDITIPYTEESYMRCGRNLIRTFFKYYTVTGIIPVQITSEISHKKKRPNTHRSRSTPGSYRKRCNTNRPQAQLHFTDLNINYDSETSNEESPYSFRNNFSPRRQFPRYFESAQDRTKTSTFVRSNTVGSPPPQTIVVYPQPTLSIVDINMITRDEMKGTTRMSSKN